MKKLSILSILTILFLFHGCTSASNDEVPMSVKAKFAMLYPNINVTRWEKEGNNYEAAYNDGSLKKTLVLDAQGQPLQTETRIDPSALPANITSYIHSNYNTYTVHEAASIMSTAGVQTYEVGCKAGGNDVDLTFDKNGNFVSKEDDND